MRFTLPEIGALKMRKSFDEFYLDNEIELEDLARESNKGVDEVAQELYHDYLVSVYDLVRYRLHLMGC